MLSFNNVEIEVGQKVIVLQTSIVREHTFLTGEVVALTKKTVQVECNGVKDWHGDTCQFNRKPQQIIVI